MMHDEVVRRRRWMSEQRFLDLLGATNLIPGPNSTEMAIHVGFARARWPGLVVAGISFIAPAMAIVLVLAWVYVRYGRTPAGEGLLYGIEPVVIAIVVQALLALGPTAVKRSPLLALVGTAALGLYLAGVNELAVLFGGGLVVMALRRVPSGSHGLLPPLLIAFPFAVAAAARTSIELDRLFLLFLKFGAIVFGSGYVLFAFIHGDLVTRYGWLTEQQLVDAIAVGQFTPGPVFTTATFIGYVLAGVPGALLATLGIFLPSFIFVAAIHPIVRLMRRSTWTADLLDGVIVAALGLMAGVTWQLGQRAITDAATLVIAIVAAVALLRFRVNAAIVIAGGAALGLVITLLR
jgi:chromate transporter